MPKRNKDAAAWIAEDGAEMDRQAAAAEAEFDAAMERLEASQKPLSEADRLASEKLIEYLRLCMDMGDSATETVRLMMLGPKLKERVLRRAAELGLQFSGAMEEAACMWLQATESRVRA